MSPSTAASLRWGAVILTLHFLPLTAAQGDFYPDKSPRLWSQMSNIERRNRIDQLKERLFFEIKDKGKGGGGYGAPDIPSYNAQPPSYNAPTNNQQPPSYNNQQPPSYNAPPSKPSYGAPPSYGGKGKGKGGKIIEIPIPDLPIPDPVQFKAAVLRSKGRIASGLLHTKAGILRAGANILAQKANALDKFAQAIPAIKANIINTMKGGNNGGYGAPPPKGGGGYGAPPPSNTYGAPPPQPNPSYGVGNIPSFNVQAPPILPVGPTQATYVSGSSGGNFNSGNSFSTGSSNGFNSGSSNNFNSGSSNTYNSGSSNNFNSGSSNSFNSGGSTQPSYNSGNSGGSFNSGGSNSFNSGGSNSFNSGGSNSFNSGGSNSFNSGGSNSFNSGGNTQPSYNSGNSGGSFNSGNNFNSGSSNNFNSGSSNNFNSGNNLNSNNFNPSNQDSYGSPQGGIITGAGIQSITSPNDQGNQGNVQLGSTLTVGNNNENNFNNNGNNLNSNGNNFNNNGNNFNNNGGSLDSYGGGNEFNSLTQSTLDQASKGKRMVLSGGGGQVRPGQMTSITINDLNTRGNKERLVLQQEARDIQGSTSCQSHFLLNDLLKDIFMGNEVIPDILDHAPRYPLSLTYKTISTFPGMHLTADMTRFKPMLKWPAQPDSLYTVVLSNLDINSRKNRTLSEFWHWFVANVPGDSVDDGEVIFDLLFPLVLPEGDGDHRYGYFVFEQPRRLDYREEGGPTDSCSPNMSNGRGPFKSTKNFMKKYNLDLTAATFIIIDSNEASMQIACEWQKCIGDTINLVSPLQCGK